jgi:ribosomal protein L32
MRECACGSVLQWEDDQWIDVYTGERHNCKLWGGSRGLTIAEKREIEKKRKLPDHCRICGTALTLTFGYAMGIPMQAHYCKRCKEEVPFSRKPIEKDNYQEKVTHIIKCPNCGANYSSILRVCPGCMDIMEKQVMAERAKINNLSSSES